MSEAIVRRKHAKQDTYLVTRTLGLVDYEPAWKKMQQLTLERNQHTQDEIWILEHHPVFTLGQASKPEHLLNVGEIPVVQTDRGGQVTYHGPGQLVIYPLIDLQRLNVNVRPFVTAIEQAIVDTLKTLFDIDSYPKKDAPGVYVKMATSEAKIASLGLRIKRGASFHGLSLNIDMSLAPFNLINPCGHAGMQMTQLTALPQYNAAPLSAQIIAEYLVEKLCVSLGYT